LRKNFRTDLNEIFREGWQWASEHMIKFLVAIRMTDPDTVPDPNPYRGIGKTCLGGGMQCPSASSFKRNGPNQTRVCFVPLPAVRHRFNSHYSCSYMHLPHIRTAFVIVDL